MPVIKPVTNTKNIKTPVSKEVITLLVTLGEFSLPIITCVSFVFPMAFFNTEYQFSVSATARLVSNTSIAAANCVSSFSPSSTSTSG